MNWKVLFHFRLDRYLLARFRWWAVTLSRWRVWTALDCVWTDAHQPVSTLGWTASPSTEKTGSEEDQSGGDHSLWRRLHRWQLQTLVEVKFSLVHHRHRLSQSGSGGRSSWSADWLVQLRTTKLHVGTSCVQTEVKCTSLKLVPHNRPRLSWNKVTFSQMSFETVCWNYCAWPTMPEKCIYEPICTYV